MKKTLILCFTLCLAYTGQAQITKGLAVKGGVNFASQNIQWSNTAIEQNAVTRWQFAVAKNFELTGPLYIQAEAGYAQMGYEVEENYPSDIQAFYNSATHLDYLYVEGGLGLEKKLGAVAPFLAVNYRYGHLLQDNMHEVYYRNRFSSSDHGINIKAGLAFPLPVVTPFIEVAYYYGIRDLKSGIHSGGDGIHSEENYNRSFSLMLGIRF